MVRLRTVALPGRPDQTVHELEVKVGCFFDRTVHVADLTGIQIVSRMTDQIFAREITVFEETRGLDLLRSKDGTRIVGAVLSNMRTGEIFVVNAKVTTIASVT